MADRVSKKYNMDIPTLIDVANRIRHLALTDIAELTQYGIDAAYLSAFEAEIDLLEVFPSDRMMRTDKSISVEEKEELREELVPMLRDFAVRAKLTFEPKSVEAGAFKFAFPGSFNDRDLLVLARKIKRNADEYLAQLASAGLTQAMIDELDTKTTAFENKLDAVAAAHNKRTQSTRDRINLANSIYDKTRKIADVGKNYFADRNYAKYSHYLIYTGAKYRKKKFSEEGKTKTADEGGVIPDIG